MVEEEEVAAAAAALLPSEKGEVLLALPPALAEE